MLILVVYDIAENKIRYELANYLKTKGFVRVQRSFFIGRPIPSTLKDVERTLPKYIKSVNDVIHLVPVNETTIKYIKVFGKPLANISLAEELLVIT